MKKISNLLLLTTSLLFLIVSGCVHRNLEEGGVYQGNRFLYEADQAITTTHDLLQDFVNWEAAHRDVLARYPEVRQMADRIVNEGPKWFASANSMRDIYAADPNNQNRDALDLALTVLKQAVRETSSYLKNYSTTKTELPPLDVNRLR